MLQKFVSNKYIFPMAVSPNGELLATSCNSLYIELHSIISRTYLFTLQGHHGWVKLLTFSPDGKTLASGDSDNQTKIWSLSQKKCIFHLKHENLVEFIAFSPNGELFASGGGSSDDAIKIWSVNKKELLQAFNKQDHYIFYAAFLPSNKDLVVGSKESIDIYNLREQKLTLRYQSCKSGIAAVAVDPKGQFLLACSDDGFIRMLELETGSNIHEFNTKMEITSVTYSPNGYYFAYIIRNEIAEIYKSQSFQNILTQRSSIVFLPQDDAFIISNNYLDFHQKNLKFFQLESISSQRMQQQYKNIIMLSSDYTNILTAYTGGFIKIENFLNYKFIIINTELEDISCYATSINGCIIALAGLSRINLYYVDSFYHYHYDTIKLNFKPSCMALSPNDELIGIAMNEQIWIWNIKKGKLLGCLSENNKRHVKELHFNLNSKLLISTNSNDVVIWNIQTKKVVKKIRTEFSGQQQCLMTSIGYILVIYGSGYMEFWNLKTLKKLCSKTILDDFVRYNNINGCLYSINKLSVNIWKPYGSKIKNIRFEPLHSITNCHVRGDRMIVETKFENIYFKQENYNLK